MSQLHVKFMQFLLFLILIFVNQCIIHTYFKKLLFIIQQQFSKLANFEQFVSLLHAQKAPPEFAEEVICNLAPV